MGKTDLIPERAARKRLRVRSPVPRGHSEFWPREDAEQPHLEEGGLV